MELEFPKPPSDMSMTRLPSTITLSAFVLSALAFLFAPMHIAAQPFMRGDGFTSEYTKLWKRGDYHEALDALGKKLAGYGNGGRPVILLNDQVDLLFEVGRVDEAIGLLELIENYYPEPSNTLRLALLYKYRGRHNSSRAAVERGIREYEFARRFGALNENTVAIARLKELQGKENPKVILSQVLDPLIEAKPTFASAYLAAGGLALRKADFAVAADYFGRVVEFEPENTEALAGLAQCYTESSDARLDATLDKLFEVNPRHPAGLAIRVTGLLDGDKTTEALRLIEERLAINPVDLQFRSLKAAALYLEDRLEEMGALQAEVMQFNPRCSEVCRTPGAVASRQYRFSDAAKFQRKALEIDPRDNEARALLGFDLLRLGRDEEGLEQLEKAFDVDPFNVSVYNMLQVMDSLVDYASIERGAFLLQLPSDEVQVLADDALDLLESAIERYEEKYDIELERPVRVQIFGDHDDFMVRSIGLPGNTGYMGICFGRLVTMDSPSARPKGQMNWRSVLWHEFLHVITLQKTSNRMARWLSEGISVYEETQFSPAWGQRLDYQYKGIIDEEGPPAVGDLETIFTQPKSPLHLMLGYFAAGEFVDFYTGIYEFGALREALAMIGEGRDTLEALTEASGDTLAQMDEKYALFMRERYAPLENFPVFGRRGLGDKLAEVLSPHRGDEDRDGGAEEDAAEAAESEGWQMSNASFPAAMKKADEAIEDEDWETAEAQLNKAYEAFPDYQGPGAPLTRLIEVHEQTGARDKLRETLELEIDRNPVAFRACERLVELLGEDEDWAGVTRVSSWALGIDPFDLGMHRALFESRLEAGDHEGALTELGLLQNMDASRLIDYRLRRIEILMAQEAWGPARRETVALLEKTPHFWEGQRLLLEILGSQDRAGNDVPAPLLRETTDGQDGAGSDVPVP